MIWRIADNYLLCSKITAYTRALLGSSIQFGCGGVRWSFNKPDTRKWFNSIFSGMWICRTWHASVRNEQKPIIRGGIISTFHLKFPPDAYTKNNSFSESFLRASSSTPENACFPISSLLPHNKLLLGVAFISFPPPRIILLCHAQICFVFQPSMAKFPRH